MCLEEEDTDDDDHLIHLEEILVRVHTDYYTKYDRYLNKELEEAPDIRKIVPELKSKVLADVAVIFSGLHPTNFPVEKTREHYHATALGAKVLTQLVLSPDAPDRATHLIAARAGTEKVRQAQECRHLHVVSPDWLWSCLERWDKVEEQLFPLTDDDARAHRENSPAAFPDRQTTLPAALFHPTPVHPKVQPGPEVRIYDSHTGKLIRTGSQGPTPVSPSTLPVHGEPSSFRAVQPHQQQMFGEELPSAGDGEQPGPTRRKRQPSMSETMPLYTLCKEDLESMDKEANPLVEGFTPARYSVARSVPCPSSADCFERTTVDSGPPGELSVCWAKPRCIVAAPRLSGSHLLTNLAAGRYCCEIAVPEILQAQCLVTSCFQLWGQRSPPAPRTLLWAHVPFKELSECQLEPQRQPQLFPNTNAQFLCTLPPPGYHQLPSSCVLSCIWD
uniref:RNA polymerase II subunit A C-terminal domain phosphatase n=1 Tax=Castor canadensis TaxID=51338 RepID=A0A8B7UDR1_CASCN|nr:RNA polymerase II subunit A C-terminal domain phosphatase-like [Castor canadensis]